MSDYKSMAINVDKYVGNSGNRGRIYFEMPADGESYLAHVKRESAALPFVMSADPRKMKIKKSRLESAFNLPNSPYNISVMDVYNTPDVMKLTCEEQVDHVRMFKKIHDKVKRARLVNLADSFQVLKTLLEGSRLVRGGLHPIPSLERIWLVPNAEPGVLDAGFNYAALFGGVYSDLDSPREPHYFYENSDIDEMEEDALPLLSLLLPMSQQKIERMLINHIELLKATPVLSYQTSSWLFALLVLINTPVSANTCNSLRTLARTCARIRESMALHG